MHFLPRTNTLAYYDVTKRFYKIGHRSGDQFNSLSSENGGQSNKDVRTSKLSWFPAACKSVPFTETVYPNENIFI